MKSWKKSWKIVFFRKNRKNHENYDFFHDFSDFCNVPWPPLIQELMKFISMSTGQNPKNRDFRAARRFFPQKKKEKKEIRFREGEITGIGSKIEARIYESFLKDI